jgi:hypothetical protein
MFTLRFELSAFGMNFRPATTALICSLEEQQKDKEGYGKVEESMKYILSYFRYTVTAKNRKVARSRPDEVNEFFSIYLILPAALGPVFTQPLTEMNTRSRKMFLGSRARPTRKADILADIC